MKHWLRIFVFALTGLALGPTVASAQSAPVRACSAEDIRQALAGDYAGPPCRFTEMPADVSPQLAGGPTASREYQARTRPEPTPVFERATPRSALSVTPSAPLPVPDTVRLSDDFFRGGLVGGVGRVPTIQYGYRGLIVIDGSGRAGVLAPGQVSTGPVVSMEARAGLRTRLVGP